jgi:hypothetical protein
VSNLPQLQAAGHVDAEGRLVKAVVAGRLPKLPAPRLGAPKPLVRVRLRCRRCSRGASHSPVCRLGAQVSVGRIDVGVAVEEAWYKRDAATGVRGAWGAVGVVGGAAVVVLRHCACGHACAVRFKSAGSGKPATAVKASGYLFNVRRDADTGKWYAHIVLRGVHVKTRFHKHAWQAAAELEWQLARWCAHTGQPRNRYVSNAARLVELGRADAAGVLTEAVTVAPWELSRWDGGGGKAAPAGERLCCACSWRGMRGCTTHLPRVRPLRSGRSVCRLVRLQQRQRVRGGGGRQRQRVRGGGGGSSEWWRPSQCIPRPCSACPPVSSPASRSGSGRRPPRACTTTTRHRSSSSSARPAAPPPPEPVRDVAARPAAAGVGRGAGGGGVAPVRRERL